MGTLKSSDRTVHLSDPPQRERERAAFLRRGIFKTSQVFLYHTSDSIYRNEIFFALFL